MNDDLGSLSRLAALGLVLEARGGGHPPAELLHAAEAVLAGTRVEAAPALLAELRTMFGVLSRLVFPGQREQGWSHTDPELLQAAGEVSQAFAERLDQAGLGEPLRRPGARFLDVGCGVARLGIAMARHFSGLSVVGI